MFHERKLHGVRMSKQSFQCIVYILRVFIRFWRKYVKRGILYKLDGLQLIICACYSWDKALSAGVDLSFGNAGGRRSS
jgi:hypothetical protein